LFPQARCHRVGRSRLQRRLGTGHCGLIQSRVDLVKGCALLNDGALLKQSLHDNAGHLGAHLGKAEGGGATGQALGYGNILLTNSGDSHIGRWHVHAFLRADRTIQGHGKRGDNDGGYEKRGPRKGLSVHMVNSVETICGKTRSVSDLYENQSSRDRQTGAYYTDIPVGMLKKFTFFPTLLLDTPSTALLSEA